MPPEEQHEMLVGILSKLIDSFLTCDELALLAYHCGVGINEFYEQPNSELRSK